MKLWLSEDARRELKLARESAQALDQVAQSLGATTEGELQAQCCRWQHEHRRLPGLETKAGSLSRVVELVAEALDRFAQEHERENDWIVRRKRAHDRDSGRER